MIKHPTPFFGPPDRDSTLSEICLKVDTGSKMDLDDVMLNILADPAFDTQGFEGVIADLNTKSTIGKSP